MRLLISISIIATRYVSTIYQFHYVIIQIPNLLKLTHRYWEFDVKDIISISIRNDVSKYIEYLHDR
jgi:hypothetical protein